jgi:hypothetical protein
MHGRTAAPPVPSRRDRIRRAPRHSQVLRVSTGRTSAPGRMARTARAEGPARGRAAPAGRPDPVPAAARPQILPRSAPDMRH